MVEGSAIAPFEKVSVIFYRLSPWPLRYL